MCWRKCAQINIYAQCLITIIRRESLKIKTLLMHLMTLRKKQKILHFIKDKKKQSHPEGFISLFITIDGI